MPRKRRVSREIVDDSATDHDQPIKRFTERKMNGKPTLSMILDFYDCCIREEDFTKVCEALEVPYNTMVSYIERYPAMAKAQKVAEQKRGTRRSLSDYVFKRLSPEAQKVWEEIQGGKSSSKQIDQILTGKTKQLRQELFIHALVCSSFDLSTACRRVGISRSLLEYWRVNDMEFRAMIDEIQWHKKNFFEKSLVQLVEVGHPGATMFVNRTINADRGYSEKMQVEHSGTVHHSVGFDIDDLDLDIETRRKILEAVRKKKELKDRPPQPIIDITPETRETRMLEAVNE